MKLLQEEYLPIMSETEHGLIKRFKKMFFKEVDSYKESHELTNNNDPSSQPYK